MLGGECRWGAGTLVWGDQQGTATDIPARAQAACFLPAVILIPLILGLMSHLRVTTPTIIAVFSFLTMDLFLTTEPLLRANGFGDASPNTALGKILNAI